MTEHAKRAERPSIEPTVNGPYLVKNLETFQNSKGKAIETQPEMSLCRCGASKNKPFCDGSHLGISFRSDKSDDRVPDRVDDYTGKEITIHDNRGVCAHVHFCTDNSPAVFSVTKKPWIDPDAADPATRSNGDAARGTGGRGASLSGDSRGGGTRGLGSGGIPGTLPGFGSLIGGRHSHRAHRGGFRCGRSLL